MDHVGFKRCGPSGRRWSPYTRGRRSVSSSRKTWTDTGGCTLDGTVSSCDGSGSKASCCKLMGVYPTSASSLQTDLLTQDLQSVCCGPTTWMLTCALTT